MFDTVQEMRESLIEAGVSPRSARRILEFAMPTVVLDTEEVETEDEITLGATKIGGCPDLPVEIPWPCREAYPDAKERGKYDSETALAVSHECPLSFVAQIDLEDVAASSGLDLPETGRLLLYYDVCEMPWGFLPADAIGMRLIYDPSPREELVRRTPPHDSALTQFKAFAVETYQCWSSIAPESEVGSSLIRGDEFAAWSQWHEDNDEHGHRFGGHPSQIQGDMARQCALLSKGVDTGGPVSESFLSSFRTSIQSTKWVFLFQIASEEEHDMMWGDSGKLFVWIHRDDLKARRFEKARLILQCY